MIHEYTEYNMSRLIAGLSKYILTEANYDELNQLNARFLDALKTLDQPDRYRSWSRLMSVWAEVPCVRIGAAPHPKTFPRVFTRTNESVHVVAAEAPGGGDAIFLRDANDTPGSTMLVATTQREADWLIYAIKAIKIHLPQE